jgi:hypothetical protein
MRRRTLLGTTAAVLSLTVAGCSGTDDGTSTDPASSTDAASSTRPEATTRPTDPATATTTREPHPSDVPDPDHAVLLWNDTDETKTLALTVESLRRYDPVHEATYEVAPGEDRRVYNLADADPVGIERFEIRGESNGRTQTVTISTNACHGHVYFEWSQDYPFIGDSSIC